MSTYTRWRDQYGRFVSLRTVQKMKRLWVFGKATRSVTEKRI